MYEELAVRCDMRTYYLYNSQTKQQLQKLSLEQVQNLLHSIPQDHLKLWFGWYKGEKDWKPLKQMEDFSFFFKPELLNTKSDSVQVEVELSDFTKVPNFSVNTQIEKPIVRRQTAVGISLVDLNNEIEKEKKPDTTLAKEAAIPTLVSAPSEVPIQDSLVIQPTPNLQVVPESISEVKHVILEEKTKLPSQIVSHEPEAQIVQQKIPHVVPQIIQSSSSTSIPSPQAIPSQTIEPQSLTPQASGRERRKYPRYDIKLRVIITNQKNTFLTFTKDVSLGGLQLINDIPDYIFNGESEVFISGPNNRDNIKFKCIAIGDENQKKRIQFQESSAQFSEKLQLWIDHVIKPKAKVS